MPRFGLPGALQSDNGPAFVSQETKGMTSVLDVKWTSLSAWRPQSSGKVERHRQTLKQTLAELCQKTQENWVQLLPIALLCVG